MTERTSTCVMNELDELLDLEREALLTGKLDMISRLINHKEGLIDELSLIETFEGDQLTDLSNKVKRNQDLLDNALAGIRTVATRLSAMRRVRRTLDTYDCDGNKRSVTIAKDGSIEKRA